VMRVEGLVSLKRGADFSAARRDRSRSGSVIVVGPEKVKSGSRRKSGRKRE
jgi:hypothetical protein